MLVVVAMLRVVRYVDDGAPSGHSHSTQVIVSTSKIATSSPYLSRSHLIRDVLSLVIAPSTSVLPTQINLDNQHATTKDPTVGYQSTVAIGVAATAGCILSIFLLSLYFLSRRARLARSQGHALEVFSPVSGWRVDPFRSNVRIDPFTPGAWIGLDSHS